MIRILAMLAFFLSLVMVAWTLSHGALTWRVLAVLGLFLWCLSSIWDRPAW
jgi:hypothetical protein